MTYLLFTTALALSAVAAYYSIMGLTAIFAAAVIPILVMGSLLEVSKLVVASWLYRSWKAIPFLMKTYFTTALIVLMLLTSMGIFGYLSKAHLDQGVPTGDIIAQVSLIDEKIKIEKEKIDGNRKELSQLDKQVEAALSRTTTAGGNERSIQIRRNQQKERDRIASDISKAQATVAILTEERVPLAGKVRQIEAEVGPLKYISAMIYGDVQDQTLLESSVRIVILLIVFVFDPLAVLMLVAANWQMKQNSKTNQGNRKQASRQPSVEKEQPEEEDKPSIEEQITSIVEEEPVQETIVVKSTPNVPHRVLR